MCLTLRIEVMIGVWGLSGVSPFEGRATVFRSSAISITVLC